MLEWGVHFACGAHLKPPYVCQVALEVEQEEDEAGTVGDTFTDYVTMKIISFEVICT